ncbi:hypothetical protein RFI_19173 [Reticulomyxa filosa]|uniref:Bromo domain-containing protein n=1 Tax=Reticulomyxa filosa TaxID=46433 RepID=X6MYG4_RETFI|nr:hypothetical protein RFI_19173 [Reticulomyxa filosa]|eukprot:ETO18115.1 hypothetical protein RFI_19173 [Reticulomyxa filosa]
MNDLPWIEFENLEGFEAYGNVPKGVIQELINRQMKEKNSVKMKCRLVLEKLKERDCFRVFLKPVSTAHAPHYYTVISRPMDLSTMEFNIESNQYLTFEDFEKDFYLMIRNCLKFNQEGSYIHKYAKNFKKEYRNIVAELQN